MLKYHSDKYEKAKNLGSIGDHVFYLGISCLVIWQVFIFIFWNMYKVIRYIRQVYPNEWWYFLCFFSPSVFCIVFCIQFSMYNLMLSNYHYNDDSQYLHHLRKFSRVPLQSICFCPTSRHWQPLSCYLWLQFSLFKNIMWVCTLVYLSSFM